MKLLTISVLTAVSLSIVGCGKSAPAPQEQVSTKIKKFTKGGFDSVMIANFAIENKTQSTIKDIEIVCDSYSETNTRIDSNRRTIYKLLAPGKSLEINEFNMGFISPNVSSTSCRTVKFITV